MNSRAKDILRKQDTEKKAQALQQFAIKCMSDGCKTFAAGMLKIAKDKDVGAEQRLNDIIKVCEKELRVGAYGKDAAEKEKVIDDKKD